jgi:hypothetical protein
VITYEWRGIFTNAEVSALHSDGFGHQRLDDDWRAQVERHSLGWVCARDGAALAGFVNVAWDGACHAFILDTLVARRVQRQGVGTASLPQPPGRPARPAASGCTSTSRTISARSISAVADSGRQKPGSSPCKRNNSDEMRPTGIQSCLSVRVLRVSAAATAGTAGARPLLLLRAGRK